MKNETLPLKSVGYAYASSEDAERLGFGATGCYTVELSQGLRPPVAVAGFATKSEAFEYAQRLPEAWNFHRSITPVRQICREYGCVKCQRTHREDSDPLFFEHIYEQSKHGWYQIFCNTGDKA